MVAGDETKARGLSFGRSLQMVVSVARIYPVEHQAVQGNLQRAFADLEQLQRIVCPFTFGFSDGRLLIEDLLTPDHSLTALEGEFKRRGIAAVTFSAGVTLSDFKDMIRIVCASPQTITARRGIEEYLRAESVAHINIIAARKEEEEQKGDVRLRVSGESFIKSVGKSAGSTEGGQAAAGPGLVSVSLEALLKSAGIEDTGGPLQEELLDVIKGVVEASASAPDTRPARAASPDSAQPVGFSLADLLGTNPGNADPAGGFATSGILTPGCGGSGTAGRGMASPGDEAGFAAPGSSSGSTSSRVGEVPQDISSQVTRSTPTGELAERILRNLASLLQKQELPPRLATAIREEVLFAVMPQEQQKASLMQLEQFVPRDFQRLVRVVKELSSQNKLHDAMELLEHCCATLIRNGDQQGLAKSLQSFLQAIPKNLQPDLLRKTSHLLAASLRETSLTSPERHRLAAAALADLAAQARQSEDFATMQQIAAAFNAIIANHPEAHAACCCPIFQGLLPPDAIDQMIELCTASREDSNKVRDAVLLFREFPAAMETVFDHLECERDAPKRIRLMRLASQFRQSGIHIAIRRLRDENWTYVRNSCQLLGAMDDPDLVEHVAPLLAHADERVYQAAFQVLQKSRLPERIRAYAQLLPRLPVSILDPALDEIMFSLDPACLEGICNLIKENSPAKARLITKALHVALILDAASCADLLELVLADPNFSAEARSVAQKALLKSAASAR